MRWTKTYIPTFKENPKGCEVKSHILSIRAGLMSPLFSGVNIYLPLGWKILLKIVSIIREEMERIGAQELLLPSLSPSSLWEETGRWKEYGKDMFKFKDRKGGDMCLAPTHEEIITEIARNGIKSYRDLPQIWFQIQTKFRDEPRPRGGMLRAREFIMKDSYSLDTDEKSFEKSYSLHRTAYQNIFKRCSLDFVIVTASSGLMGGSLSEEFMVFSKTGEDAIVICENCGYKANRDIAVSNTNDSADRCPKCGEKLKIKNAIEIGHIFRLGEKYSRAMGAFFLNTNGDREPIIMGSYGIGVERIMACVIETKSDNNGIIWPPSIAPYKFLIIPLNVRNTETRKLSEKIYKEILAQKYEVLIDDRDETPGTKFKDADLIGIPFQIVIGEKGLDKGVVELVKRDGKKKWEIDKERAVSEILQIS